MNLPSGNSVAPEVMAVTLAPVELQLTSDLNKINDLPADEQSKKVQAIVDRAWGDVVQRLGTEGIIGGPKNAAQGNRPRSVAREVIRLVQRAATVVKNPEVLAKIKSALATHDAEEARHFATLVHGSEGWEALRDGRAQSPRSSSTSTAGKTGDNLSSPQVTTTVVSPDTAAASLAGDAHRSGGHGKSTSSTTTTPDRLAAGVTSDASLGREPVAGGKHSERSATSGNGNVKLTARGNISVPSAPKPTNAGKTGPSGKPPERPASELAQASRFTPVPPPEVVTQQKFAALTGTQVKATPQVPETVAGEAQPEEPAAFARLAEGLHYCVGEGTDNVPPHVRHAAALSIGMGLVIEGRYDGFLCLGAAWVVASAKAYEAKKPAEKPGVTISAWLQAGHRGEKPKDRGISDDQASLYDALASNRLREGTKNLNRV